MNVDMKIFKNIFSIYIDILLIISKGFNVADIELKLFIILFIFHFTIEFNILKPEIFIAWF